MLKIEVAIMFGGINANYLITKQITKRRSISFWHTSSLPLDGGSSQCRLENPKLTNVPLQPNRPVISVYLSTNYPVLQASQHNQDEFVVIKAARITTDDVVPTPESA